MIVDHGHPVKWNIVVLTIGTVLASQLNRIALNAIYAATGKPVRSLPLKNLKMA